MVLETKWKKLSENKRENRVWELSHHTTLLPFYFLLRSFCQPLPPSSCGKQAGRSLNSSQVLRQSAALHSGKISWRFLARCSMTGWLDFWSVRITHVKVGGTFGKGTFWSLGACSSNFRRFEKSFFRKHWVEISAFCAVNFPEINDRTFRLRRLKISAYAMCSFSNDV